MNASGVRIIASEPQKLGIDVLRRLPAFADLTDKELQLTGEACVETRFGDGDFIVEEGVRGPGLFLIVDGLALVQKAKGRRYTTLAKLFAGEAFGEMSLVNDRPTSASVRAVGDVVCLFVSKDDFVALIDAHPTIGKKVLWHLATALSSRLDITSRRYIKALRRTNRRAGLRHMVAVAWVETLMLMAYLWVWFRRKIRLPHKKAKLKKIHLRHARRFKNMAFRLKGANIKIGQLASLQVHILPREFITEFRALRDAVPPTPYPLVAGLIEHEFGVGPLELFAEFHKTPIAAASMAQVHEARLKTGERVVVKVLHPGLEQSVAIDLWLTRQFIRTLSWMFRKVDLHLLFREAEAPLRKELDFMHEAKATEELAKDLKEIGVIVPAVHWQYTTRRVLTLKFIEGCSLSDRAQMDAWGVDRKALMQSYLRAFFHQAFEGGFFHCDPHPANAFSTPEGKLVLLDFGMVKRLPERVRVGLVKEVLGGFFNNVKMYADGIIERGVVEESDREVLESFAGRMFSDENMRAAVFDHDLQRDGDLGVLFNEVFKLLKDLKTFKTPTDQLMFMRALGIVIDVCREVYPEESVSDLTMPVAMPVLMRFLKEHPQYAADAMTLMAAANMSDSEPPAVRAEA